MREERDKIKSEFTQLKDELTAKNEIINNLQTQLNEKETAIAKLKSELEVRGDIQLNLFPPESTPTPEPEIIPTPEPESENTESPAVNSEPLTVTPTEVVQTVPLLLLDTIEGTVSVGGLMKHIRDMKKDNPNFPDPPEKTQTFTDAVTGKTNRLGELEKLYGFKLAGYVLKGKSREYRYKILDN